MSERNLPVRAEDIDGELTPMRLASAFVKSGYFTDLKDVAQAIVKIQAGAEAGFGPMASIMGMHIVQGKPTWSANLMAAAIKRSGRYNYRVRQATDEACEIEFFEGKDSVGTAKFTIKEAQHAGLANKDNWKNYASDMLFARALSRGCRRYCPDVFGGVAAYAPEDLNGGQSLPEVEVIQPEPPADPPHAVYTDDKIVSSDKLPTIFEAHQQHIREATTTEALRKVATEIKSDLTLTPEQRELLRTEWGNQKHVIENGE